MIACVVTMMYYHEQDAPTYPINVVLFFQDMRKQEWTAIIPNSQLIVIPYPHNNPRRYRNPSNTVLMGHICAFCCLQQCALLGDSVLLWKPLDAYTSPDDVTSMLTLPEADEATQTHALTSPHVLPCCCDVVHM